MLQVFPNRSISCLLRKWDPNSCLRPSGNYRLRNGNIASNLLSIWRSLHRVPLIISTLPPVYISSNFIHHNVYRKMSCWIPRLVFSNWRVYIFFPKEITYTFFIHTYFHTAFGICLSGYFLVGLRGIRAEEVERYKKGFRRFSQLTNRMETNQVPSYAYLTIPFTYISLPPTQYFSN